MRLPYESIIKTTTKWSLWAPFNNFNHLNMICVFAFSTCKCSLSFLKAERSNTKVTWLLVLHRYVRHFVSRATKKIPSSPHEFPSSPLHEPNGTLLTVHMHDFTSPMERGISCDHHLRILRSFILRHLTSHNVLKIENDVRWRPLPSRMSH